MAATTYSQPATPAAISIRPGLTSRFPRRRTHLVDPSLSPSRTLRLNLACFKPDNCHAGQLRRRVRKKSMNNKGSLLWVIGVGLVVLIWVAAGSKGFEHWFNLLGAPTDGNLDPDGERLTDDASVSAPVFGAHWQLVGAISLSGSASALSQRDLVALADTVAKAAQTASRSLGGRYVRRTR